MGASVLPVTIYKGKLYFLFGKERPDDENPGWSDFGGGTDDKESYIQTAIREGGEELTGFLGSDKDVKHLLQGSAPLMSILRATVTVFTAFTYFLWSMIHCYHFITTIISDFCKKD